jgi:osmotically-inducible protein OsmY
MKKILKLSLVSLCATGAVIATQAHEHESASISSDKQLVVTEPAGADNSATSWQSSSSAYQSGPMQGQQIYESSGAAIGAPHMVTGRDQDCYADCILHKYQAGKGSARVTDEHYWNNVPADRLYAQYPASGAMYQNYAYNTSYSSQQPMAGSSSSSMIVSSRPSAGWSGSQGLWYAPDGRIYNSQGVLVSGGASGSANEAAGAARSGGLGQSSSTQSGSYSSQSSATQSGSLNEQSSSSAQPSATQSGTSGQQSSTELKGSQSQQGSATSEAAGAQPSTSSSAESTQPSSSNESSTQPSSTSTSPDQSSTQSSTSTSPSEQGMTDKVRSTLKSDQTLSPISSNVTVQDQNGKVALNGTVKSEAEKQQVVSKAEEIAGSGNVIDNLQVQSESNSGSSNPSPNSNQ